MLNRAPFSLIVCGCVSQLIQDRSAFSDSGDPFRISAVAAISRDRSHTDGHVLANYNIVFLANVAFFDDLSSTMGTKVASRVEFHEKIEGVFYRECCL